MINDDVPRLDAKELIKLVTLCRLENVKRGHACFKNTMKLFLKS